MTPLMMGITNSKMTTPIMLNSTAELLKKELQAPPRVEFWVVIVAQSAMFPMLESNTIATYPMSTITTMLIII